MTAQMLDGEATAAAVKERLRGRVAALVDRGVTPGLGTILVGDDGPSARYVAMKHADAAELGIHTADLRLAATATQAEVEVAVERMNADPAVDAFIIQYPLPDGLDFGSVMARVRPEKDADGMHPTNLGRLVMGEAAPLACTPAGIVELLAHHGVELAGRHVVVVGRGLTIGRPLVNLLTLKSVPVASAALSNVHSRALRSARSRVPSAFFSTTKRSDDLEALDGSSRGVGVGMLARLPTARGPNTKHVS